jgi:hypothetical protein
MQDRQISKKKKKDLLDPQMHLQLVDEAQSLVDADFMDETYSEEKNDTEWDHLKNMDIWYDRHTMAILNGGQISTNYSI